MGGEVSQYPEDGVPDHWDHNLIRDVTSGYTTTPTITLATPKCTTAVTLQAPANLSRIGVVNGLLVEL